MDSLMYQHTLASESRAVLLIELAQNGFIVKSASMPSALADLFVFNRPDQLANYVEEWANKVTL